MLTPRISIHNMHVRLGNTTHLRQLTQIPTQFKDEMEQTKLHCPQLVNVEIFINPFFLNMQTEINSGSHVKAENQRGKPYHKTIAAVFLASLLEVRDNKQPSPDDVAMQKKVICLNCTSQRLS